MLKAVAFIFLFSCTERTLEPRPAEPVPIRLYTGILTRASVNAFDGTSVSVAYGGRAGEYDGSWEGVATDNEIRLTPERYYPIDGSAVYLRGYYPPAPLSADGKITYRITGEEDLMLTGEQSGSMASPLEEEQPLMYRHLLMRLNFMLTVEAERTDGIRVRSLHLNGVTREVILVLATESLTAVGETFPLPVYTVEEGGDGLEFADGKLSLPGYVLVPPSATFSLDLTLAVDDDRSHDLVYSELPIRFEEGGALEGGVSYTVKVELPSPSAGQPEATAVATVGEWQTGNSGSGELNGERFD